MGGIPGVCFLLRETQESRIVKEQDFRASTQNALIYSFLPGPNTLLEREPALCPDAGLGARESKVNTWSFCLLEYPFLLWKMGINNKASSEKSPGQMIRSSVADVR